MTKFLGRFRKREKSSKVIFEEQMLERLTQKINIAKNEMIDIFNRYKVELDSQNITRTKALTKIVEDVSHEVQTIHVFIKRSFPNAMSMFDDATAAVAEDTEVTSSAITLLDSLSERLAASAGDPVAVAQLVADLRGNSARMAAAIVSNTAVDTPPVDEPPVDVPPVDEPPVDVPPVDEPPVDVPPVDVPPVDSPPIDPNPVDDGPADSPPIDPDLPTDETPADGTPAVES